MNLRRILRKSYLLLFPVILGILLSMRLQSQNFSQSHVQSPAQPRSQDQPQNQDLSKNPTQTQAQIQCLPPDQPGVLIPVAGNIQNQSLKQDASNLQAQIPAQDTVKPTVKAPKAKLNLKDTLDQKLDLSDYLINMHGFVPWPVIISEPSLGSFGLAMALVFISPKKTAKKGEQFHFPDITGVAGMWTLNNTWGVGGLRQGSFPKIGMRYNIVAAYADININFYRNFTHLGEKEVLFKLKTILGVLDVSENLFRNKLFAGLNYTFSNITTSTEFENIPDSMFNQKPGMTKNSGLLGLYLEWDSRNTIFTPDKGIRTKASFGIGRNWTISDFDYEKSEVFINGFFRPVKWWVCGLRADWQWVGGNAPFYLLPYIKMRGIGAMVYQGDQVLQLETEQRFDVTLRWSVLGFAGVGKTFSSSRYLDDPTWHVAGGAGFRYLLSRIFRMRMGVDLAVGPDQFAYYIVLGHYWN